MQSTRRKKEVVSKEKEDERHGNLSVYVCVP